ncbi:factor VII-activating protease-like isoform X2 [Rhinoraja longicauda]
MEEHACKERTTQRSSASVQLFRGGLCEIGIDDCCKEDNESTYQGHASHARHGKRCLYWNSHIILSPQMILQMQNNGSEFEEHNYCRF